MSKINISATAIRYPVLVIVATAAITLLGILSFANLDMNNSPDISFPVVSVTVSEPGGVPSDMEYDVTEKIEDAVANVEGLNHTTSTIGDGVSKTTLEFQIGYNLDRVFNDVQAAVSRVRSSLPSGIQEPLVERQNVTGGELLTYAMSSKHRSITELSHLIDNQIGSDLKTVEGLGEVKRLGGVDREIRVDLDPFKLMSSGVTVDEINSRLKLLNVNLVGGRLTGDGEHKAIRVLGGATTIDALANITLPSSSGGLVRLADLAHVTDGTAEQTSIARFDDQPVVGFSILRAPHSSEIDVARDVEEKIDALSKSYDDISFNLVVDNVKYTKLSLLGSFESLLLGAFLSVIVVWWFLRDSMATFISACAIPLSIVPTAIVMNWLGFSLNSVTLLAVSIVVGILVDDAIVEIENIIRHIRMGKSPYQATLDAADEIGLAVVATTATIIAVFLPVSFMSGIVGQYFKSFGLTAATAVFFSLVIARCVTPPMAAFMMKSSWKPEGNPRWITKYLEWLAVCMRHKWKTAAVAVLIFVLALVKAAFLPLSFIPAYDDGVAMLDVSLPPGTTVAETDASARQVASLLSAQGEVLHTWTTVGSDSGDNQAVVTAILKPKNEREGKTEFQEKMIPILQSVAGIKASFSKTGGWGDKDISLTFVSADPDKLEDYAGKLEDEMRSLDFLANVNSDGALKTNELQIRPKMDLMAQQSISASSVSQIIKTATLGDNDTDLSKFNYRGDQIPIRVRIDPAYRGNLDVLKVLRIRNGAGVLVPLSTVATITEGSGPNEIQRLDRMRQITLSANLLGKDSGEAMEKIKALPAMTAIPDYIKIPDYGEQAEISKMVYNFSIAILAGILLMFAVLAILFNNFAHPFTILTAIPLSLTGAFGALLVTGTSFSLSAFIGVLMLLGIVAKNSILIVEYAQTAMKTKGLSNVAAVTEAVEKRARPVVMTSVAMGAGMLPIALGISFESAFQQPMAITVVGGIITSTVLSLFVVPVCFVIFDNIRARTQDGHWMTFLHKSPAE